MIQLLSSIEITVCLNTINIKSKILSHNIESKLQYFVLKNSCNVYLLEK